MIYLDHNATTPTLPAVADAVRACQQTVFGNASSQHSAGRAARRVLRDANDRIAALLGASTTGMESDRLILTSGGTESNNLALLAAVGLARESRPGVTPHVVISAIEHPSIAATAELLEQQGVEVDRASANSNGVVSVDAVQALLKPQTCLVSVMLANNETGVVQPVSQIAAVCRQQDIALHTDATQAVGKISVDFAALGATMMTFTAHKFHGPAGIGGLLVRAGYGPLSLLAGQAGLERPGTPAVALAVGMQVALDAWHDEKHDRLARMTALRNRLETQVCEAVPGTVVVGEGVERLPHTSNLAFVGFDRQALAIALDRAGIACSTGSACASGSSEPSPTLLAMGLSEPIVRGSLRLSLGALTTTEDIDLAVAQIKAVCDRLRQAKSR